MPCILTLPSSRDPRRMCRLVVHNADLQIGEIQCVDRCVGKYMQAQDIVTAAVQQFETNMQQQQKAGVNVGNPRLGGGPPRY